MATAYPPVFGGSGSQPAFPQEDTEPVHQLSSATSFNFGLAFFVPPSSFVDQSNALAGEFLASGEIAEMEFQVSCGGHSVGKSPFLLRRPPVVLVHGLTSSPENTWRNIWRINNPARIQTRIYYADYSATSTKGMAENYPVLAKVINKAILEYRWGNDVVGGERPFNGIRYAATRVDVIAHSLGGQIARTYISDLNEVVVRGGAWEAYGDVFDVTRTETPFQNAWNAPNPNPLTGQWPYLRSDNYWVGDIRRLVTMGSPFRGSPWAIAASSLFEPTSANLTELLAWAEVPLGDPNFAPMPQWIRSLIFPGWNSGNETYVAPTGAADLSPNSAALLALENADYPELLTSALQ